MTAEEVLKELESLGSEQTRKTYRRHGVGDNVYGVSFANLDKLTKKIKVNHSMALALWASGNFEGRILATRAIDPARFDEALADQWVKEVQENVLSDALAISIAKATIGEQKMQEWLNADEEYISRVGWTVLALFANNNKDLADSFFEPHLEIIQHDIHQRKNFVRHAMNNVLIAIGTRNAALQQKALEVAAHVGKVVVNHGATSCKTPDATDYIHKTLAYRQKKLATAKA